MQENAAFQDAAVTLIWWGGFALLVIGLVKIGIYLVGVSMPDRFERLRSETLRRFLTGKGNRLVFGLGGLITAAVGGVFMLAAKGLALLGDYVGR